MSEINSYILKKYSEEQLVKCGVNGKEQTVKKKNRKEQWRMIIHKKLYMYLLSDVLYS